MHFILTASSCCIDAIGERSPFSIIEAALPGRISSSFLHPVRITGAPLIGSVSRFPLSESADNLTDRSPHMISISLREVFLFDETVRSHMKENITEQIAIGRIMPIGSLPDISVDAADVLFPTEICPKREYRAVIHPPRRKLTAQNIRKKRYSRTLPNTI